MFQKGEKEQKKWVQFLVPIASFLTLLNKYLLIINKYCYFYLEFKTLTMFKRTDLLLKGLHIISWIIFVGVCIEAGGVLTNTIYTVFFNPDFANKFWNHSDLSVLFRFNQVSFVTLTSLMSIVALLKATLFYIIIKIFHDKKLDFNNPFNATLGKYIVNIAYCAIGIGLFSKWGSDLCEWIANNQVSIPSIQKLNLGGADVWFFMGFVIFIFAKIFKKGIELQTENDLTV